ncbi:MAG TPA: hypothetical protein VF450_14610, partial [Noviherbaspirillum sp.]
GFARKLNFPCALDSAGHCKMLKACRLAFNIDGKFMNSNIIYVRQYGAVDCRICVPTLFAKFLGAQPNGGWY